jgi:hypothetical protein
MLIGMAVAVAYAQDNPMTVQRVDSRKGFIARIPAEAMIDSSRSGWSLPGQFERRLYRIPNAGLIRFTVTIGETLIPDNATRNPAYTYLDTDSATSGGTAYIRTYYLPTRSVRIEVIPESNAMRPYIEARESIFTSFRWKSGANTAAINVP